MYVGMEPSTTSRTRWERHHAQQIHTIPTSCAFLPTMCLLVVEGKGEGIARCVVHVDVHGECVMLWVAACICY